MTTKLGRVTSVVIDGSDNEIKVSVVTGPNRESRIIPFKSPSKGMWAVPSEGDIVEVYEVDREPVARIPHNSPDFDIPADLSQGDFCVKINDGTQLWFKVQNNGTVNVDLTADGEVSVTAPSVLLGDESGTFEPVARKGDPVSVDDPDSGTLSGQIEDGSSSVKSS